MQPAQSLLIILKIINYFIPFPTIAQVVYLFRLQESQSASYMYEQHWSRSNPARKLNGGAKG